MTSTHPRHHIALYSLISTPILPLSSSAEFDHALVPALRLDSPPPLPPNTSADVRVGPTPCSALIEQSSCQSCADALYDSGSGPQPNSGNPYVSQCCGSFAECVQPSAVGRSRLTASKSAVKAPMDSTLETTGLSRPRIARDVARRRRGRKVPPGEPARSAAPLRGRARVSPAPAVARSLRRRRYALVPLHSCYIALCAKYICFRFLSY